MSGNGQKFLHHKNSRRSLFLAMRSHRLGTTQGVISQKDCCVHHLLDIVCVLRTRVKTPCMLPLSPIQNAPLQYYSRNVQSSLKIGESARCRTFFGTIFHEETVVTSAISGNEILQELHAAVPCQGAGLLINFPKLKANPSKVNIDSGKITSKQCRDLVKGN